MRIEFNNGVVFETGNLWRYLTAYRLRNIVIGDVESENHFDSATGVSRTTYFGTDYDQRLIEVEFEGRITCVEDFEEKRSDLQRIFNSGVGRLIFNGYEIDVVKDGTLAIERLGNAKIVVRVTLITVNTPYFKRVNNEVLTIVNGATLNIENLSDTELDPRYMDVTIRFTLHADVNFFQITGADDSVLRITRAMSNGDVIELKGGTTYLNGEDILEDTTMDIITIPVGESTLQILGTTSYKFELEYPIFKY